MFFVRQFWWEFDDSIYSAILRLIPMYKLNSDHQLHVWWIQEVYWCLLWIDCFFLQVCLLTIFLLTSRITEFGHCHSLKRSKESLSKAAFYLVNHKNHTIVYIWPSCIRHLFNLLQTVYRFKDSVSSILIYNCRVIILHFNWHDHNENLNSWGLFRFLLENGSWVVEGLASKSIPWCIFWRQNSSTWTWGWG